MKILFKTIKENVNGTILNTKVFFFKIEELEPLNNRHSFYGKCYKMILEKEYTQTNKNEKLEILYSYESPIMARCVNIVGGETLWRLADKEKFTNTTCSHVYSFCELTKKKALKEDKVRLEQLLEEICLLDKADKIEQLRNEYKPNYRTNMKIKTFKKENA